MTNFLSLEKQRYVSRTMDGIINETNLLREWFKKEYPEADLKIHIDFNKILLELHILIRVTTGREMSFRGNRGFFECPIVITEKNFMRDSFMTPFLRAFNDVLRKNIATALNQHYHSEEDLESQVVRT